MKDWRRRLAPALMGIAALFGHRTPPPQDVIPQRMPSPTRDGAPPPPYAPRASERGSCHKPCGAGSQTPGDPRGGERQ